MSKRNIISITRSMLFFFSTAVIAGNPGGWLDGQADANVYESRQALYEYIFRDFEKQSGLSLRDHALARKRLINAVNKAVEDWLDKKQKRYREEIRYLIFNTEEPFHYVFDLSYELIDDMLHKSK